MKEKIDELYEEYLMQKLKKIISFEYGDYSLRMERIPKITYKIDQPVLSIKQCEGKFNDAYLIENDGRIIEEVYDPGYDSVSSLGAGMYLVKDGSESYVLKNQFKKAVCFFSFDSSIKPPFYRKYYCGYIIVTNGKGEYNYLDTKGKLLFQRWFKSANDFYNGYSVVEEKNGKYSLINNKGNTLVKNVNEDELIINPYFVSSPGYFKLLKNNTDGYKVHKKIMNNKYIWDGLNDKLEIDFEPIRIYGTRYFMGINKNSVFLLDRSTNEKINLGLANEVEYSLNDNFITNKKTNKVYFIYQQKLLDISMFYEKYLSNGQTFGVNDIKDVILTKEEFSFLNERQIEEAIKEEKVRKQKEKDEQDRLRMEQEREEQKKKLEREKEKIKKQKEDEKERVKQEKIETLKMLQEGLKKLRDLRANDIAFPKEKIENIFIKKDNHLEIDPDYQNILMLIDLSQIKFKNVKVNGIDFRNTNIMIDKFFFNPQEVYKKDLSNCNFEGIHISPFVRFDGVDIRGSKFSADKSIQTADFIPNFEKAIYDDDTTYNGIPVKEIIAEKKQRKN